MVSEDSLEHRSYLIVGETPQREFLRKMFALKGSQEMRQGGRDFVAPIGEHKEEWQIGASTYQVQKDIQACLIAQWRSSMTSKTGCRRA